MLSTDLKVIYMFFFSPLAYKKRALTVLLMGMDPIPERGSFKDEVRIIYTVKWV